MTAATIARPATSPSPRPLMSLSALTGRRSAINAAIAARPHHDPRQPGLFDAALVSPARIVSHPAHAARVGSVLSAARA